MEPFIEILLAFLEVSGVAYYVCMALPKPVIKSQISRSKERLLMFAPGTLLLSHVIMFRIGIRFFWGWLIVGLLYVIALILSYFGYVKWNVLWQKEVDRAAQMVMFGWDFGIALSALIMASMML